MGNIICSICVWYIYCEFCNLLHSFLCKFYSITWTIATADAAADGMKFILFSWLLLLLLVLTMARLLILLATCCYYFTFILFNVFYGRLWTILFVHIAAELPRLFQKICNYWIVCHKAILSLMLSITQVVLKSLKRL